MGLKKGTDYCTWWFEGNWAECCFFHDSDFANPNVGFIEANLKLYKCVKKKRGRLMASLMFTGTSTFGLFFWLYCRWQVKTGRI